ncbi:hypothetical protein PIB30_081437 [Stylosanthes scabra]|uniref:Myb/SANT-like DNA-binding domain-containing protein n=1 Tax=Stylosanthes scabra TaxID=79078 RepID=A0ABU6XSQ0_9FABA|nr:hypothetical protein [Stylosanthes scabra]
MDKHIWSDEETEAFVGFMEEFTVDATRLDCGQFRAGTFEKLALKMIERFPSCTLTAKHCRNKHKRMKEKYQYAADMLLAANSDGMRRSNVLRWIARMCSSQKFYTPNKPFAMFHRLGRIFGKDRATGSATVSGFDAEEQVDEEPEDDPILDDHFMAFEPTADGPAQTEGNAAYETTSSMDPGSTSRRTSGKKRKQADILERMADEVHESTVAQREHVQILANAIFEKNAKVKMGEKLEQLGFADHEAIHVVL